MAFLGGERAVLSFHVSQEVDEWDSTMIMGFAMTHDLMDRTHKMG